MKENDLHVTNAGGAHGGAGHRRLDLRIAFVDAVSDFVLNAVVVSVSPLSCGVVDVDAVLGLAVVVDVDVVVIDVDVDVDVDVVVDVDAVVGLVGVGVSLGAFRCHTTEDGILCTPPH